MNIFEDFEYRGKWWLPSNPEKMVAGFLSKKEDKIVLELVGSFTESNWVLKDVLNLEDPEVIHGRTSDNKEITLLKCHGYGRANSNCTFAAINFTCDKTIIGKHVNSLNEKTTLYATFKYPALSYWCSPRSINTIISFNDKKKIERCSISFDCTPITINATKVNDDTTISLKCGVDYYGDHYNPKIKQSTFVEINKNENSSIKELLNANYQFQQFLSLASLEEVGFNEAAFFDEAVYQLREDGTKHYVPIYVIDTYWCKQFDKEEKKFNFLFEYIHIESKYSQIITNWYKDIINVGPIRRHLIDSVASSQIFSSVVFLTVIQALEGYYCRFIKDGCNLTHLLNDLKNKFKDIVKIANDDFSVDSMTDSRHYYSHLLPKGKKKNALDGWELYEQTEKLRRLLICCILELAGFNHDDINSFFSESQNKYIRS